MPSEADNILVELAVKNGLLAPHEAAAVLAEATPQRDASVVLLARGIQQRHLDSLKKKVAKQLEKKEEIKAGATVIQTGPGAEGGTNADPGSGAGSAFGSGSGSGGGSQNPTHAAPGSSPPPELDPQFSGVILFGQIALKHKLIAPEDLQLALARQAELDKMGVKRRIGEILVDKQKLDAARVQKVLAYQEKFLFGCARCGQRWNVYGTNIQGTLKCPQCQVTLQPLSSIQSIGVQGTLARGALSGASPTPPSALPRQPAGSGSTPSASQRKAASDADPAGLLGIEWRGHKVEKVLGRGGMGAVYMATQLPMGRKVALKVILRGAAARKEERERFVREARDALAKLGKNNPYRQNIVQVFLAEHDENAELAWFTMECVQGRSFKEALTSGKFPMDKGARIVAQLARAIGVAHDMGIVHRDLKPQNIMLDESEDPDSPTPKILDFGLAKTIDQDTLREMEQLTQVGAFLGTPSYMAPEQAGGDPNSIDGRADIYALGAILYEVMTGRPPFKGKNPMETIKQVLEKQPEPPTKIFPGTMAVLEPACLKALAKDPDKRFQKASELAAAIDAALGPDRPSGRAPAAPRTDDTKPKGESSKGLFGRLFGG
ncbi:MAG: serine/threonine-protein kinase [Planctomycetota bacterium]